MKISKKKKFDLLKDVITNLVEYRLLWKDMSNGELAKHYGVSESSIINFNKQHNFKKYRVVSVDEAQYKLDFPVTTIPKMMVKYNLTRGHIIRLNKKFGLRKTKEQIDNLRPKIERKPRYLKVRPKHEQGYTEYKYSNNKAKWMIYIGSKFVDLKRYNWEKVHGPIPEGHFIVYRDFSRKDDCSVGNLIMIKKEELPHIMGSMGRKISERKKTVSADQQQRLFERKEKKRLNEEAKLLRKQKRQEKLAAQREARERKEAEKLAIKQQRLEKRQQKEQAERFIVENRRKERQAAREQAAKLKQEEKRLKMEQQWLKQSSRNSKRQAVKQLPTLNHDLSKTIAVKIDSKTIIHIRPDQDKEEVILRYRSMRDKQSFKSKA